MEKGRKMEMWGFKMKFVCMNEILGTLPIIYKTRSFVTRMKNPNQYITSKGVFWKVVEKGNPEF